MKHLAIFEKSLAEAVFSGSKKIDGRFSKIKVLPFGKVSKGDVVWIKVPGGKILGYFKVLRVISFDHPGEKEIEFIKTGYKNELSVTESFWKRREKINFATLIFIDSVGKFLVPPKFVKKDLRPWVIID